MILFPSALARGVNIASRILLPTGNALFSVPFDNVTGGSNGSNVSVAYNRRKLIHSFTLIAFRKHTTVERDVRMGLQHAFLPHIAPSFLRSILFSGFLDSSLLIRSLLGGIRALR